MDFKAYVRTISLLVCLCSIGFAEENHVLTPNPPANVPFLFKGNTTPNSISGVPVVCSEIRPGNSAPPLDLPVPSVPPAAPIKKHDEIKAPVVDRQVQAPKPASAPNVTQDPGAEQCVEVDAFTCGVILSVVKGVNAVRAQNGLAPIAHDPRMSYATGFSAKYQAMNNRISHDYWNGGCTKQEFTNKFGNENVPLMWGENAAMQYFSNNDPEAIGQALVKQWQGSPDHLKAMLNPNNSSLGVGFFDYGAHGSGAAYSTLLFASKSQQSLATSACSQQMMARAH